MEIMEDILRDALQGKVSYDLKGALDCYQSLKLKNLETRQEDHKMMMLGNLIATYYFVFGEIKKAKEMFVACYTSFERARNQHLLKPDMIKAAQAHLDSCLVLVDFAGDLWKEDHVMNSLNSRAVVAFGTDPSYPLAIAASVLNSIFLMKRKPREDYIGQIKFLDAALEKIGQLRKSSYKSPEVHHYQSFPLKWILEWFTEIEVMIRQNRVALDGQARKTGPPNSNVSITTVYPKSPFPTTTTTTSEISSTRVALAEASPLLKLNESTPQQIRDAPHPLFAIATITQERKEAPQNPNLIPALAYERVVNKRKVDEESVPPSPVVAAATNVAATAVVVPEPKRLKQDLASIVQSLAESHNSQREMLQSLQLHVSREQEMARSEQNHRKAEQELIEERKKVQSLTEELKACKKLLSLYKAIEKNESWTKLSV